MIQARAGSNLSQNFEKVPLILTDFRQKSSQQSVRNSEHVEKASLVGAHIATVPPSLYQTLWSHPLTDKGIAQFMADWESSRREQINGKSGIFTFIDDDGLG